MQRPTLRLNGTAGRRRSGKAQRLGLVGGLLSRFVPKRLPPIRGGDLKRYDYPMSTQRIGVRFTDRMRDTFRFRWIRRTRP